MFSKIVSDHSNRYPTMQIQDIYKLAYQAALGSEHAISSPSIARQSLILEINEMGPGPDDPMLDSISPNQEIVRVHLRPFLSVGGNMEELLKAFVLTSENYHGDTSTLEEYWKSAIKTQLFTSVEMVEYFKSMKDRGFPAAHHSREYRKNYHPAYRVIERRYLLLDSIL
jgi:hypothetical protein